MACHVSQYGLYFWNDSETLFFFIFYRDSMRHSDKSFSSLKQRFAKVEPAGVVWFDLIASLSQ